MIEHTYFICQSSWCINIKIIADFCIFNETFYSQQATKVANGIWIKFADKPLIENEIFCNDDLPYLVKGLQIVQKQIAENSCYNDTLIIINSLQFSLCDFQKEGLTAAIMEWASVTFKFEMPNIIVNFDKEKNKYTFNFAV